MTPDVVVTSDPGNSAGEDAAAYVFADGVLTVTLPKNPQAKGQARRIPIGAAAQTQAKEAPKAA